MRLCPAIVLSAHAMLAQTQPPTDPTETPSPASRFDDRLTGSWGGLRDRLLDGGLGIEASTTGFYDGLFSDGPRDGWRPGGRADAFVTADLERLGMWNGGALQLHLESRFGDIPGQRGGALWPVQVGQTLPLGREGDVVASSIYLTQRLSESTTVLAGKINAIDLLAKDPFFGGWGRDRFQNLVFVAPPSGVVPPTIVGAVLLHEAGSVLVTAMAFDPNDRTRDYAPDDLFADGVNLSLGASVRGEFLGRASSLGLTGTYSTKDATDLGELLLPPDLRTAPKDGSSHLALQFGHLLVASAAKPDQGLGVYAKFGIGDGNPNPVRYSAVGGLSGHGLVPGRPLDSFGVGWFAYSFSKDLQDSLAPLVDFDAEYGQEVFYQLAVSPWCRVSFDLQVIEPATGGESTAVYGGIRANLTF